ncbi:MAG: ABC transporter permease, partial [Rhodanobacteraceae bacterium]
MSTISLRSLRHAARQLTAQPGFSLFAMFSLAIGLAATVTLFSTVDTLLFAPVPGIGAPAGLVELGGTRDNGTFDSFSAPDFDDYATRAKGFADLFAYRHESLNIDASGEPQRALGVLVSGHYFDALQVRAYRGRVLDANDDRSGAAPAVVATYAGWRKYFDGDEAIVGKPVSINGHAFTLVGVTDPDFHGTIALLTPAFYAPLHQLPLLKPGSAKLLDSRESSWLSLGARLATGTSPALAARQLSAIAVQLASEYPRPNRHGRIGIDVFPLRAVPAFLRGGLIAFSVLLFALVSLLLLVACVNVASMLLARGENRRHEIAVRYVLGARRSHVIAQLLTESLLLSLAACAIGVALSAACCRLLAHLDLPTPVPVSVQISLNATALWFAFACAVLTALA